MANGRHPLKLLVRDPASGRITEAWLRINGADPEVPLALLSYQTLPDGRNTLFLGKVTQLELSRPPPAERFKFAVPGDWLVIDERTRKVTQSGKEITDIVWADTQGQPSGSPRWRMPLMILLLLLMAGPPLVAGLWKWRKRREV